VLCHHASSLPSRRAQWELYPFSFTQKGLLLGTQWTFLSSLQCHVIPQACRLGCWRWHDQWLCQWQQIADSLDGRATETYWWLQDTQPDSWYWEVSTYRRLGNTFLSCLHIFLPLGNSKSKLALRCLLVTGVDWIPSQGKLNGRRTLGQIFSKNFGFLSNFHSSSVPHSSIITEWWTQQPHFRPHTNSHSLTPLLRPEKKNQPQWHTPNSACSECPPVAISAYMVCIKNVGFHFIMSEGHKISI
jgi:hypothetical protein